MGMLSRRLAHKNKFEKNQFSSNTLRLMEDGKIFTLNYRWIFGSALSILIGLFTMYTAMHYLTAYVSPKQILWSSQSNSAANQMEENSMGVVDKVLDSFTRDQAYIRRGKGLAAHYVIPEGKSIELRIVRCQPQFIVEVFRCTAGDQQIITLNKSRKGVERLSFNLAGFYVYQSRLINSDGTPAEDKTGYRVVWHRA
ncbi:hypothetical protein [Fretibacter rubidus]|uniref:hypothetical protein n=1 Tax=Fretibacter rubidus TaxID=570162 RepID=UPI00352ABACE